MGKGKGGETKTEIKIPEELKKAAIDNLARTEKIGQIGYMPYRGPSVAAQTPRQETSMRNTNLAAKAFGLRTTEPGSGMPAVSTGEGGARGYDASGLLDQAISNIPKAQRDALARFFINPAGAAKKGGGSAPVSIAGPLKRKPDIGMALLGKGG